MANSLVEFWNEFEPDKPPYIHPSDKEHRFKNGKFFLETLPKERFHWTFDNYLNNTISNLENHEEIHPALLPSPYAGNLENADIFVLWLNPGLNLGDYYGEFQNTDFKSRSIKTLQQDFKNTRFPFMWLDPSFCWHPGFVWWERKFKKFLQKICIDKGKTYLQSLEFLSNRVAAMELFPYHSIGSPNSRVLTLPSVNAARLYVRDTLIPKCKNGEIAILVMRAVEKWKLTDSINSVESYWPKEFSHPIEKKDTRSASLYSQSEARKLISNRLGISEF